MKNEGLVWRTRMYLCEEAKAIPKSGAFWYRPTYDQVGDSAVGNFLKIWSKTYLLGI